MCNRIPAKSDSGGSLKKVIARYHSYWAKRTTPEWDSDHAEHYALQAAELALLFGSARPGTVLEIGCGSGALYPYLDLDGVSYRGVDFSPSMLTEFRKSRPGLDLVCAEGSAYRDERTYDLIFSNGLIQYFDPQMLRRHVENARAMMHPGSTFVCGGIPWKTLRLRTEIALRAGWLRRGLIKLAIIRPGIGHWYSRAAVARIAEKNGLDATFFGSLSYMYRFHVVMRVKQSRT